MPKELPIDQTWLIERMFSAGYDRQFIGKCAGLAAMAMQAILANEVPQFIARLRLINDKELVFFTELKTKEKKTQEEVDILAFFDGMQLHQDYMDHSELFEALEDLSLEHPVSIVNALLTPSQLESSIVTVMKEVNVYNEDELTKYLTALQDAMVRDQIDFPVSFRFGFQQHAITVKFNLESKTWTIFDLNHMERAAKEEEVAALVDRLLSVQVGLSDGTLTYSKQHSTVILSTTVDVKQENLEKMNLCFAALQTNEVWKNIHAVTNEKASYITKDGFSWLFESIVTDPKTAQKLLDNLLSRDTQKDLERVLMAAASGPSKANLNVLMHAVIQHSILITPILNAILKLKNKASKAIIFKHITGASNLVRLTKKPELMSKDERSELFENKASCCTYALFNEEIYLIWGGRFYNSFTKEKILQAISTNAVPEVIWPENIFPKEIGMVVDATWRELYAITQLTGEYFTNPGMNVLSIAMHNHPDVVQPLLDALVTIENPDELIDILSCQNALMKGQSPLIFAANYKVNFVEPLLKVMLTLDCPEVQLDILNLKDWEGNSALSLLERDGQTAQSTLLKETMASLLEKKIFKALLIARKKEYEALTNPELADLDTFIQQAFGQETSSLYQCVVTQIAYQKSSCLTPQQQVLDKVKKLLDEILDFSHFFWSSVHPEEPA